MKSRPLEILWHVFLTAACCSLIGALESTARGGSVGRVDYSEVPALKEFAGKVRRLCDEVYPRIVEKLADDDFQPPARIDIVFKNNLPVPGATSGTRIALSGKWFLKHKDDDFGAIVHEMAHVVQSYPRGQPRHWTEGIADYIRYTLGYKNKWSYPHCPPGHDYGSGYWCTAAFLMYVEEKHDPNFVRKLNRALRSGKYQDDIFKDCTGKTLHQLWNSYQKHVGMPGPTERELCSENLRRIGKAIRDYRRDTGNLPNWLSDLVPKYIPDKNVLICPVTVRTGRILTFGIKDPKLKTSYVYEFCAAKVPGAILGGADATMKELKMRQKELVGSGIPIVRCHLHRPVLNLGFNGRLFDSPTTWENLFTNPAVTLEDLMPRNLFKKK